MQEQDRWDLIAQTLDAPETRRLYGRNDQLLWWLDRGTAALALRDNGRAIGEFEQAESFMDIRHGPSATDSAAAWLINDTATEYIGEPYESIYVNVFKLCAQLEQGVISGGATVEARRAASKANMLRDRYVKYKELLKKEGGTSLDRDMAGSQGLLSQRAGSLVAETNGEFVESPLATYLTAVTFMADGDTESQAVAGRRLADSIRLQRGILGIVDEKKFAEIGDRRPTRRDLLVVAFSGQGPTKHAERFGPIPVYQWPVYFEIPVLVGGSMEATAARVVIEPTDHAASADSGDTTSGEAGATGATTVGQTAAYPLALVEELSSVAMENHRRQLPLIYARAFLRSSAKAAAAYAASQAATNHGKKDGWTNVAVILGGLALVTLTERADLRCWETLPGQAHVGLFAMPERDCRVRIEYLAMGGGLLYATPWREVRAGDYAPGSGGGGLKTVVEFCGR